MNLVVYILFDHCHNLGSGQILMRRCSKYIAFGLVFYLVLSSLEIWLADANSLQGISIKLPTTIEGDWRPTAPLPSLPERIIRVKIHPTLPLYKLRLVANPEANSIRIEVSRMGTPGVIQVLKHPDWLPFGSNANLAMKQTLLVEDMNFDGYLDIRALDSFGVRILTYRCWVFDKERGRFVYSKALAKITEGCEFRLNTKKKEIHTVKDCENTSGRIEETYSLKNGRFLLVSKKSSRY
jgi:hypothetical protein